MSISTQIERQLGHYIHRSSCRVLMTLFKAVSHTLPSSQSLVVNSTCRAMGRGKAVPQIDD